MSVRNLPEVLHNIDGLGNVAVSALYDSVREAAERVTEQKARGFPVKTGRFRDSMDVWYSKSRSRRYQTGVFRVGYYNKKLRHSPKPFFPNFYSVLSKGRKGSKKAPRYPNIRVPAEDTSMVSYLRKLSKQLFDAKIAAIESRGKL
jgi:hypothetical protein